MSFRERTVFVLFCDGCFTEIHDPDKQPTVPADWSARYFDVFEPEHHFCAPCTRERQPELFTPQDAVQRLVNAPIPTFQPPVTLRTPAELRAHRAALQQLLQTIWGAEEENY